MIAFRRTALALSIGLLVAARPAAAQKIFDFANLKYFANTYSGFLPTNGLFCTGGDKCSSDINRGIFGGGMTYVSGGLSLTASAFYTSGNVTRAATAVQDHENGYNGLLYGKAAKGAGLGVYHRANVAGDDNITTGEKLKLTFLQAVTIGSIGLRSEGHNTTAWTRNATFQYSKDNVSWTTAKLPADSGKFDLNLTSREFYFQYGGTSADQFYLSSATVVPDAVPPANQFYQSSATVVPEPSTYMLMAAGLGALGIAARRKRNARV